MLLRRGFRILFSLPPSLSIFFSVLFIKKAFQLLVSSVVNLSCFASVPLFSLPFAPMHLPNYQYCFAKSAQFQNEWRVNIDSRH